MPRRSFRPAHRHTALGVLALAAVLAGPGVLRAQGGGDTLSLYHRGLHAPVDPNGFLLDPRWLPGPVGASVAERPAGVPDIDRRCRFRAATGNLDARFLLTTRGPCLSADELDLVTLNETTSSLGEGFVCSTNSLIGDIHGHVNWFPVTVTGQLYWAGYSALPGDQDLNFDLGNTPLPGALTTGNPHPRRLGGGPAYRVELSHPETLQRLIDGGQDDARAWWRRYGATLTRLTGRGSEGQSWWVDLFDAHEDDGAMRRLVNGRIAVVTGLFGLDAVHGFQSELHPAYGLFVLMDTARVGGRLREEWAFLVRDLGNEGECSSATIPMVTAADSVEDFAVDLGAWAGAGTPAVALGPAWSTDSARVPSVESDTAGSRLVVTFGFPRPAAGGGGFLAFGTIYVAWPRDGAGSPLDRFYAPARPWLQTRAIAVTLDSLDAPAPPPRSRLADAREFLEGPGASQPRLFQSPLAPVRPRALRVADSASTPPDTVRAGRALPIFAWTPVTRGCGPAGADPICRAPVQLLTVAADAFDDPFFSPLYVYSRVLRFCSDECALGQILGALAYRVDFSVDRFRRSCVAAPCQPRTVPGWSARLSPILTGNEFRLGQGAGLIPYTLASIGASFLAGQRASPLLAAGFGLRLHTAYFDVFVEAQDNVRTAGSYENRWAFPVGAHIDFASLLR